jgi:CrcB protein
MNFYNILLVGIGGMFGSIARYVTSISVDAKLNSVFPYGTFVVNILGSLILGLIIGWVNVRGGSSQSMKLLLATGFCGGFTTFSTFALENVNLLNDRVGIAVIYIVASLIAGILAVVLGLWISRSVIS